MNEAFEKLARETEARYFDDELSSLSLREALESAYSLGKARAYEDVAQLEISEPSSYTGHAAEDSAYDSGFVVGVEAYRERIRTAFTAPAGGAEGSR